MEVVGEGAKGTACPFNGENVCITCGIHYGFLKETSQCEQCVGDDKRFSGILDDSACKDHTTCGPGQGSNYLTLQNNSLENSRCEDCLPGSYSDESGWGYCKSCQVGSYQNQNGTSQCIGCNAGSYSSEKGNTADSKCKSCEIGSYQNQNGTSQCLSLIHI